jgi:uncharacterized membrane protein
MLDINDRLNNLETRLLDIEIKLGIAKTPGAAQPAGPPQPPAGTPLPAGAPPQAGAPQPARPSRPEPASRPTLGPQAAATARTSAPASIGAHRPSGPIETAPAEPVSATQLMAWAAGFALLLAAVYFLKLVYDVGWLTPERQLMMASLAGIGLIAAGIAFARVDRDYAAYLPALGLIILYLDAYAAHLYYHLWSGQTAIAAVSVITVAGIWLGRRFDHSVYAILAAIGVYLCPVLMQAAPSRLTDVVIFYSAWSLLFSFCALNEGRRITYVLPMFFALIGFDLVWRTSGEADWLLAVIYQLIQFGVFASTAAAFSVIHRRPLNDLDAIWHGFALIYFYGLEYLVLHQHAPQWAPIVGLLSALFVFLVYLVASIALKRTERVGVGSVIVSTYCSIAVGHAVFFELLPHALFAWAALIMAVGVAVVFSRSAARNEAAFRPVMIVAGVIFCGSFLMLVAGGGTERDVPMPNLALGLYAAVLYGGYYLFSRSLGGARAAPIMLYAAHFAFMVCAYRLVGGALPLSMVWAVFAVLVLGLAISSKDKVLGQSALLIFAASGLKVLLHDLSASGSLVRVMTLIVLAVSLYVGGWLYQSLVRRIRTFHPDPAINRQINAIHEMAEMGMKPRQIAQQLITEGQPYHGEGAWSEERVAQILRDYP